MEKKYKISLIFGGKGMEHSVSVEGAEYAFSQIDRSILDPIIVYIKRSGEWVIPRTNATPRQLAEGKAESVCVGVDFGRKGLITVEGDFIEIDCALPLLHGDFGEDGTVQGTLRSVGIPFIGCDLVSGAICYDKTTVKTIAEELLIPTAKWRLLTTPDKQLAKSKIKNFLPYPVFIKPSRLGSSFGAALVKEENEFDKAYDTAYRLGEGRVIIEEAISIEAELECGYFGTDCKEMFTEVGEIRYNGDFYDYETKYSGKKSVHILPRSSVSEEIKSRIKEYSSLLCERIGIKGICRFDFFHSRDGRLLFNEINTMPGFTGSSLYPRMLIESGISVSSAITQLVTDTLPAN